jgi:cell division septal protein FtsQ
MYERTYHSKVLKADPAKPEPKSFPWKRVVVITSVIAVFVGFILLTRIPKWQVTTVTVNGTQVADPEEVAAFVKSGIEGRYLFSLMPRRSILLVHPKHIARQVHAAFPRFKEVHVQRSAMNALTVDVSEYKGVYLWCEHGETEVCSFMDERGIVFAAAPYFSGDAYLKIFVGERGAYPFTPISTQQLALVTMLDEKLRAINIDPVDFYFNGEHELVIDFSHHGDRAKIFIDPTRDVESALEALFSALRTDPLRAHYADSSQVLQYLDLRFSNKVVYKFQ